MKRRAMPWGRIAGGAFALTVAVLDVQTLHAGSSSAPRAADARAAQRTVVPATGPDERVDAPTGDFVVGKGLVEPRDREIRVAAQVAGRIAKVHVKEGDHVERGAVLAELESDVEQAALSVAEADLEVARAELRRTSDGLRREDVEAVVAEAESARARAALSKDLFARATELAEHGSISNEELVRAEHQSTIDEAVARAAAARGRAAMRGGRLEDVLVARARVASATAKFEQARAALARLTITAPASGEVLSVDFRPGEYYAPSARDPIVIVGDLSRARVRVEVDERDVARLALGARAKVTINALPGKRLAGRVVEIAHRMGRKTIRTDDPAERVDTKIIEVVVELEPTDVALVSGQRVTAYLDTEKGDGAPRAQPELSSNLGRNQR